MRGECPVTADTFPHEQSISSVTAGLVDFKQTFGHVTKMIGYTVVLAAYVSIFIVSIATLALIEIRRANLKDFDALIAILEQQERYFTNGHLERVLTDLAKDINQYRELSASLPCSDKAKGPLTGPTGTIQNASRIPNGTSAGQITEPQSCEEVKAAADQQLYGLLALQDDLSFEKAELPKYYDKYTDGLRDKAPQLIPLLRYVDSRNDVLTAWARLPLELLEMLLLVGMGALGGVIAVTRCFVDTSTPNPLARDLCYRPAAGGVIALGIYVLFRAMQLFFGGGGQDGGATVSTSVFLLAALGLASGFCAREAVAQIEKWATQLLHRAESDRNHDGTGLPRVDQHRTVIPPPISV
jgi:hypothetical protein